MHNFSEILGNFPWTIIVLLILVGAGLIWYGNRNSKVGLRSAGLSVVSLGLLLGACHFLIDTDAERAEKRTRQIVDFADKKDWGHLQTLLDADTTVSLGSKFSKDAGGPTFTGAKDVADSASRAADLIKLKQVTVASVRTAQDETGITITFRAYSLQDETQDRPVQSDWEFDYRLRDPSSDTWDLKQIRLLTVDSMPAQDISG